MPQLPFVQVIAVVALVTLVGIVAAIPTGKRAGARAGRIVLRASAGVLIATIAACLWWGWSTGDLATFHNRMGLDGWLQIGAFFLIIHSTAYRFVGRYLHDLEVTEKRAAADAIAEYSEAEDVPARADAQAGADADGEEAAHA